MKLLKHLKVESFESTESTILPKDLGGSSLMCPYEALLWNSLHSAGDHVLQQIAIAEFSL